MNKSETTNKANDKVKVTFGNLFAGYLISVLALILIAMQVAFWFNPEKPKIILAADAWECKQVKQVYGKLQCINWQMR